MRANTDSALQATQRLTVKQVREWGEILSGFETKNKYVLKSETGEEILLAVEQGGGLLGTLLRLWLKASRPFTMLVLDTAGNTVLKLKRPFRFFFHCVEVENDAGVRLGEVRKRWSLFRRVYDVLDEQGRAALRLLGPFFRPWTFRILKNDAEVGVIRKKWSGLLKEAFSDADNFGIEFGPALEPKERTLLLAGVFLIDFVHFENKGD